MNQEELKQRLIELIASKVCDEYSPTCDEWQPHDCGKCYANNCHIADIADHLIANCVTVRERGEMKNDCKHYDEELDCCKCFSDWEEPMPVLHPCIECPCGMYHRAEKGGKSDA